MIEIIDSHCHLNRIKLNENQTLDDIIDSALKSGVKKILTVSVALSEYKILREYSDKYKQVFHSVGTHPSEFNTENLTHDTLKDLSLHEKCVAIGETGLDYFYNESDTQKNQKERFALHINVANEVKKPIIVHTRGAKSDTLDILKAEKAENCGGVMHCFTEDWVMAKQALDLGFYISISGIVTFENANDLKDLAKKIPLDRLLVETDAPYLTPVPFRGKSNFPEYTVLVAKYIADLKNISYESLAQKTVENTEKLFKF